MDFTNTKNVFAFERLNDDLHFVITLQKLIACFVQPPYDSAFVIIIVTCDRAGTRPDETTLSLMTRPGVFITP